MILQDYIELDIIKLSELKKSYVKDYYLYKQKYFNLVHRYTSNQSNLTRLGVSEDIRNSLNTVHSELCRLEKLIATLCNVLDKLSTKKLSVDLLLDLLNIDSDLYLVKLFKVSSSEKELLIRIPLDYGLDSSNISILVDKEDIRLYE